MVRPALPPRFDDEAPFADIGTQRIRQSTEPIGIQRPVGAVMAQLLCASCNRLFTVRPQSPAQTYCSDPACQRKRRQLWNKRKLFADPDYRANQQTAQQAWHARNPDYWHSYRLRMKHPNAACPPSPPRATSDASSCGADSAAGLCWIEIHAPGVEGSLLTWRVELTVKPPASVAKSDACK